MKTMTTLVELILKNKLCELLVMAKSITFNLREEGCLKVTFIWTDKQSRPIACLLLDVVFLNRLTGYMTLF